MEFPKYKVGQIVHIVKAPLDGENDTRQCDAGWAHDMSQYCGEETTIIDSSFDHRGDRYCLDIDGRAFVWSPDCPQNRMLRKSTRLWNHCSRGSQSITRKKGNRNGNG